jgi:hypothetical protein
VAEPSVCDCLAGLAQVRAAAAAVIALERLLYVVIGFDVLGIVALACRITLSVRRRSAREQSVYFPIAMGAVSVIVCTEVLSVYSYLAGIETSNILAVLLQPFWSRTFLIELALFPGLTTAAVVVSLPSPRRRIVAGPLVAGAGMCLVEAGVRLALRGLVQKQLQMPIYEILAVSVGGGIVGLMAAWMLVSPILRVRFERTLAVLIALAAVVWLGSLLVSPINQRVVTTVQEWERMTLTPSQEVSDARKITVRARWLKFVVTNDGITLRSGSTASRWQPTLLEVRRTPPPGFAQAARVPPFGEMLPGQIVYTDDFQAGVKQFKSPSRECAIVGQSVMKDGVDLNVNLTPLKRIRLTMLRREVTEWADTQHQSNRPSSIAIDLLEAPGALFLKSSAQGVFDLFCHPVLGGQDAPRFGIVGQGPAIDRANSKFGPRAIGPLRVDLHPGVLISVGRSSEVHDVAIAANVTSVTFEAEALRLGDGPFDTGMPIRDLELEGPKGQIEIGISRHTLEQTDEIGIAGDQLRIRRRREGDIRVDGRSRRVVINGELLSRTVIESIPQWLQEKLLSLLILIATNVGTLLLARRRYRSRDSTRSK